MTDHEHDHKEGEAKHSEHMSRRSAAKYAGKVLLSAGAAALALLSSMGGAKAGYGACSISGCPCQAFTGNQNNCQNCGHRYTDHW